LLAITLYCLHFSFVRCIFHKRTSVWLQKCNHHLCCCCACSGSLDVRLSLRRHCRADSPLPRPVRPVCRASVGEFSLQLPDGGGGVQNLEDAQEERLPPSQRRQICVRTDATGGANSFQARPPAIFAVHPLQGCWFPLRSTPAKGGSGGQRVCGGGIG
jgi:hypothetical protein